MKLTTPALVTPYQRSVCGAVGGDRGEVDDAPRLPLHHAFRGGADQLDRRLEVDGEDAAGAPRRCSGRSAPRSARRRCSPGCRSRRATRPGARCRRHRSGRRQRRRPPRSRPTTLQPALRSASAAARPMPRAAPVTSAVFSRRSPGMVKPAPFRSRDQLLFLLRGQLDERRPAGLPLRRRCRSAPRPP